MTRTQPTRFGAFGIAAATILTVTVLSYGAAVFAASMRFALTGAIALAVSVAPVFVRSYAERALGPRGPIYAASAALVAVPFVFLGAASALSEPLVHNFPCDPGIMAAAATAPLALGVVGTPVATASWLVVRRAEWPRVDRALRVVTVGVLAATALLLAFATVRRAQRVEPRDYLASLPVVAELTPASWKPTDLAALPLDQSPSGAPFTTAFVASILSGPSLYAACPETGECRLWTRGRDDAGVTPSTRWMHLGERLEVRHDRARDLFVLGGSPRLVVFGNGEARLPLYPRHVRDALAAPRDWLIASFAGLVLASALLLRGRARERAAASVRFREGFVTGERTVVFADGASVALPTALPEGTSVTTPDHDPRATTFRSSPTLAAEDLREGTREDRAAEARALGTGHVAWALLIVASTAAPLVACVVHRIGF